MFLLDGHFSPLVIHMGFTWDVRNNFVFYFYFSKNKFFGLYPKSDWHDTSEYSDFSKLNLFFKIN